MASGTHTPADMASGPPTPTLDVAAVEKQPDESSKLKTFLNILRKYVSIEKTIVSVDRALTRIYRFIGVSDLASVRFSLPANLMEPVPNLEYWTYLDSPETFIRLVHVAAEG